jgi:hypothetical protein
MPEMEKLPDFDDEIAGGLDLPDFNDIETSMEASDFVPEEIGDIETSVEVPDFISEEIEFEEIPEDSDLPDGQSPIGVDKDGFTEVSMDDFLEGEELESINKSIDIGDLDNIPDLSEEVPEIPPVGNKAPAVSSGASSAELSNQLLMKIAEELSSIKQELSSLKSGLSLVRNTQESQDAHGAAGGGFFDEEDDEKIALTGDELDNILNTANFTEEAGAGENIDVGSFTSPDENAEDIAENDLPLSGNPDILVDNVAEVPFDGEKTSEFGDDPGGIKPADSFEPEPVEEITDDFDISLDLSEDLTADAAAFDNNASEISVSDSDDGLEALREEGVKPMTQVEGDTSYLEEDPLASVPSDEQIDFSSAVIDEPDLSSRITENPIVDPEIENISIDIDMEEPEIPETGSGDFNLESEETMEIPVMEESLIDDFFPISDSAPVTPAEAPAEEADAFAAEPPVSEAPDDFGVELPVPEEPAAFTAEPPVSEAPDDFGVELPAAEEPPAFAAEPPAELVSSPENENENSIPSNLKQELKTVLSYMDQLLESLPEDKIEEFAKSEYFDTYKKLFEELGLV